MLPKRSLRPLLICAMLLVGPAIYAGFRFALGPSPPAAPPRTVTVYCSADAPVAQPIFDAFTARTGIVVQPVFDTEATKTTGLVNRLLAEHASGTRTCDVWWSSEPFGTIRLSRAGALVEHQNSNATRAFERVGGRPISLRGRRGDWYGFALRERVILWNTKFVRPPDAPRELGDLIFGGRFAGRIGIARPQFGTTRGHMAAIRWCRPHEFGLWVGSLNALDLRIFDGNASVAKAVATGEIHVGLTDSDDAINGKLRGWPIDFATAGTQPVNDAHPMDSCDNAAAIGPFRLPNTLALVSAGPNPLAAAELIDFLLSVDGETLMRDSEAHTIPVHPTLVPDMYANGKRPLGDFDWEAIADHIEPAMKVCDDVLKGK